MILLIADLHLGDTTHDEMLTWREAEANRIVDAIFAVIDENPGLYTHAFLPGDTFDSRKPAPWAYVVFARLLDGLRTRKIVVRVIVGNHDAPAPGMRGPLHACRLTDDELVDTPRIETFNVSIANPFDVVFLPWVSRANLVARMGGASQGRVAMTMVEMLRAVATSQAALVTPGRKAIAVTHFTLTGSTYSSDTQPYLGESSETLLPRDLFPSDVFSLVVSGHVHKSQVLPHIDGLADAFHVGSPKMHDFGEAHDPRIVALDPYTLDTASIPMPATRFVTIDFDGDVNENVRGAVVRVKGTMPAGEESAQQLARFLAALKEAGALKVAKPAVKFTRHDQRVITVVDTNTDPEVALRDFADAVGGDYKENIGELTALQRRLMGREVDE